MQSFTLNQKKTKKTNTKTTKQQKTKEKEKNKIWDQNCFIGCCFWIGI